MGLRIWGRVSSLACRQFEERILTFAANDWGNSTVNITQVGTFTKAPYKYKLTPLEKVEELVKAGAGIGKV